MCFQKFYLLNYCDKRRIWKNRIETRKIIFQNILILMALNSKKKPKKMIQDVGDIHYEQIYLGHQNFDFL